MALESKSIDEETTDLADVYDSLIAPKKLWRNHHNKLYLALRSFGAGKIGITDAALALRNRYAPLYCDDVDLYSTAKLVGTSFKQGAGSIIRITILNKDIAESKTLAAGIYNYQSALGMIFYFEVSTDYVFDPEESRIVSAISREKGSFPVARNASIKLFRTDGAAIDKSFIFSCEENAGQLGYADESAFDFRARILNDADRQDHIRELELRIRNLPNIFECNLMMNESAENQQYDGITLGPKELLVTITGVPTDEIAKLVAGEVLYATHMVDPEKVVYYHNELYVNGKYPVYYRFHNTTDFSLSITYQYDQDKLKAAQVEDAVRALFKSYTQMITHIDIFGEADAYRILANLNLPNTSVLKVDVCNDADEEVQYIRIPRTRLARLTGITFTAVEIGGEI